MLEHIRVARPWVARVQDLLTPAWKRLSDGCNLNRATFETTEECGFRVEKLTVGLGGWVGWALIRPGEARGVERPTGLPSTDRPRHRVG
jgi:hypothetical protein